MRNGGRESEQEPSLSDMVVVKMRTAYRRLRDVRIKTEVLPTQLETAEQLLDHEVQNFVMEHLDAQDIMAVPTSSAVAFLSLQAKEPELKLKRAHFYIEAIVTRSAAEIGELLNGRIVYARSLGEPFVASGEQASLIGAEQLTEIRAPYFGVNPQEGTLYLGAPGLTYEIPLFSPGEDPQPAAVIEVE